MARNKQKTGTTESTFVVKHRMKCKLTKRCKVGLIRLSLSIDSVPYKEPGRSQGVSRSETPGIHGVA